MFDRGYGNRIRGMGQPTRSFGDSHDKLTEAECDLYVGLCKLCLPG